MKTATRHLALSLALAGLLAAPFADAARIGKGKSSGMQRSMKPAPTYQQAAPAAPAMPAQTAPAPQRSGPGVGTAIAAGAAGAAAGYMLGNAMSDNQTASANSAAEKQAAGDKTAAESGTGGMGIGTLLLLALGGFLLFRFIRRRQQQQPPLPTPAGMVPPNARAPLNPNAFKINPTGSVPVPPIGGGYAQPAALTRLPDGTEVPHFVRQAKATFMHLQSMYNPDNVEEVRKYLTPELFEQLRADIAGNPETADFPQLDCQVVDASTEADGRIVASVRFSGLVSESVGAPALPFAETWHFIKSDATSQKWVVAGIQQDQ